MAMGWSLPRLWGCPVASAVASRRCCCGWPGASAFVGGELPWLWGWLWPVAAAVAGGRGCGRWPVASAVGVASCRGCQGSCARWMWLWTMAVAVAGGRGCGQLQPRWWVAGCLGCGHGCGEFRDVGWCCCCRWMVAPALVGG